MGYLFLPSSTSSIKDFDLGLLYAETTTRHTQTSKKMALMKYLHPDSPLGRDNEILIEKEYKY